MSAAVIPFHIVNTTGGVVMKDMDDVRRVLTDIWRELLPGQEVSADSDFIDCGGTSVLAVHMAALVQERLAVPLDAVDVVLHRSFRLIAEHVEKQLAERAA